MLLLLAREMLGATIQRLDSHVSAATSLGFLSATVFTVAAAPTPWTLNAVASVDGTLEG